jgi:hypothetical protein
VRQSLASKDMNPEAEESMALGAITITGEDTAD